jgi:pimeloyl-ACP methyl ester carboxylesterase/DNA-binding CsgD family transcriptional regulator
MLRPSIEYAETRDGVSIAYASIGSGPIDLVVVPGMIGQVELAWEEPAYEQFMSRLTSFARVITLDRRGTGLSDPVQIQGSRPRLSELALDVEAVMDAAESDRAVVFGFSLGSMIALQFAADHPARVMAVVVIGAMAKIASASDFPAGIDPAVLKLWAAKAPTIWGTGGSVEADSPTMRSNKRYREWAGRLERHTGSPGVARQLIRVSQTYDLRGTVEMIHAPTLVIHREGDRVISVEQGRYLAAHLPDATYLELAGDDHTFFLGDQRVMIEAVLRYLDQRVGVGDLAATARRGERKGAYAYGWLNLTPGEKEIAILVASGLSNKEIAGRLRKSPHTVDGYLRRVFAKLDVSTRVGVAAEYSRASGHS